MTGFTYGQAVQKIEEMGNLRCTPMLEAEAELLALLGNPQKKYRCIHVAGTNGKGTTAGMIAAALTRAGYRTGLYTSPSLIRLNERIAVDGKEISDGDFASVFGRVLQAAEKMTLTATKFDVLTAGGFLAFAEAGCDFAVLEVGLGGRFDSTNVIGPPEAAVITSVSLDHTALLGPDVATVAAEKSGIIKPGTPFCVCAPEQHPDALAVIQKTARAAGVPLIHPAFSDAVKVTYGTDGTSFEYKGAGYRVSMPGRHFVANAVSAIETLLGLGCVPEQAIQSGVASVRTPARFETVCTSPRIIFDGAHNPDAAARLAENIRTLYPNRRVLTVMGMFADKDCARAVPAVAAVSDEFYAVTAEGPRAVEGSYIAGLASGIAKNTFCAGTPEEGLATAVSRADADTVILCCGSFSLYCRLRLFLNKH